MSQEIVVFKKESKSPNDSEDVEYELNIWRPGITHFLPPNKSNKYMIYWFFYIFRIFKNRNYFSYLLYNGGYLVSSLLVIPSYFKWPFMGKNDVQFTYVMTNEKFKGKGIAGKLIKKVLSDLQHDVDNFWYVTDTENIASIKIAEKIGFQHHAKAKKSKYLNILKLEM